MGTRIGLEDYLLGVSNAGIATVLYLEIFKKRLYRKKPVRGVALMPLYTVLVCLLFYGLFKYAELTSFYASLIALLMFCTIMIYLRRDLFLGSAANGVFMALVALPVYWVLIALSPGVIDSTYIYETLSGVRVTGIPIEELVFYFVFGVFGGLLNETWNSLYLRGMPSHKKAAPKKKPR